MKIFKNIYLSLPFQLIVGHVKNNQLILGCWLFLLLIATSNFGNVFGIPYLFLDPEYLNKVGFFSFFLVGLSFGGLIVAFHISSYILYGTKYSFIGILEKPFSKFSINNSLIPLTVLVIYITQIIWFQLNNEYASGLDIVWMISGFLLGIIFIIILLYSYFWFTNKDIFQYLSGAVDKQLKRSVLTRKKALVKLKESKESQSVVNGYLDLKLKYRTTKNLLYFYDKAAVIKVFDQNHFNSVVIESLIIGLILLLRFFMDNPYFQIPAAASVMLLLTIIVMLAGAISFWFGTWGLVVALTLFFTLNTLMKTGVLNAIYEIPGLDYKKERLDYTLESINNANQGVLIQKDKKRTIAILENWKLKQTTLDKPKMILLCVSGGGQRSALWTLNAMSQIDKILEGQLMKSTALITGASGGMVGAAYYRELALRRELNKLKESDLLSANKNISKDHLNPIIFSLLVNDLALRNQRYTYANKKYLKDRGYAFETQFNKNTNFLMDKKLIEYRNAESQALIPMMILSPTMTLDGRKLYVSPYPVRYMNYDVSPNAELNLKHSGIDFLSYFDSHGSEDLKFLTALRMNASFPYITPNLQLPTNPPIEIMDAGISDNFGISDALKFLYIFNDWIADNTSGVIILSIRDTQKMKAIEGNEFLSVVERFSAPISSVYNNLGNGQDIDNDYKLNFARSWFTQPLDLVEIEYNTNSIFNENSFDNKLEEIKMKGAERASLSWHLTQKEKDNIIDNFNNPSCQKSVSRLKNLISDN